MYSIKTFRNLCKVGEQNILNMMYSFLISKNYNNVEKSPTYLIAEGNIPVALVAHADTVFKTYPKNFFYDAKQTVMWSPSGMGADDRAGIYAIIEIIKRSELRPHVIITTGEECGCIGASKLISDYPVFPYPLKYMIQLDRRGSKDCVFYGCDNHDFQKFIESYGFKTEWGSFSDISVLAPAWKIAAVNLSVGYFNEHTASEFLCFQFLHDTINKVKQMLAQAQEHKAWEYMPAATDPWLIINDYSKCCCDNCGQHTSREDLIPVEYNNYTLNLCIDCFGKKCHKINSCHKCGSLWLLDEEDEDRNNWVCPDCKEV